jgi:hypothetical protein
MNDDGKRGTPIVVDVPLLDARFILPDPKEYRWYNGRWRPVPPSMKQEKPGGHS